jgi:hypothetical protein
LWVQCGPDEIEIHQGDFLEEKGRLYVISHDDDAEEEGGFRQYDLQFVAGPTDQQAPNRDVDMNIRGDYE